MENKNRISPIRRIIGDILRLPAPSSFMNYGANVLSEVILELVELMPGQ